MGLEGVSEVLASSAGLEGHPWWPIRCLGLELSLGYQGLSMFIKNVPPVDYLIS